MPRRGDQGRQWPRIVVSNDDAMSAETRTDKRPVAPLALAATTIPSSGSGDDRRAKREQARRLRGAINVCAATIASLEDELAAIEATLAAATTKRR